MSEWTPDRSGNQVLDGGPHGVFRLRPEGALWIAESKYFSSWLQIDGRTPVAEAKAKAMCEEFLEHRRDLHVLGRREERFTHGRGTSTPWGPTQCIKTYADGVVSHSTAGHGGFHLSAARNAKVPAAIRDEEGWYEEDCAWACVAITFPSLFTNFERRHAERTMQLYYGEVWDALRENLEMAFEASPSPSM